MMKYGRRGLRGNKGKGYRPAARRAARPPSGCDLYLSPEARKWFPYAVECKYQEKVSLWQWWNQCVANAEKESLAPLLLIRRSRTEPLAVLRWKDLLDLVMAYHDWMMLTVELLSRAMAAEIPPGTKELEDEL